MTQEQVTKLSAENAELRNIIVHQAAQILEQVRATVSTQATLDSAKEANGALVAEVQRLRRIFEEQEKARADIGSVSDVERPDIIE